MSKLTRSEFIKKSEKVYWSTSSLDELEKLEVILPDPPEPKKLTVLEAAAEIGKGNKVKNESGFCYPNKERIACERFELKRIVERK